MAVSLMATFTAILLSIPIGGATVSTDDMTRYYVKPNNTSPCPYHRYLCKTLDEYARYPGQYFTSDTRIIFLPGNHSLNTTLVVGNVIRLALVGLGNLPPANPRTDLPPDPEPSTIITCTASTAGLLFENASELTIEALAFIRCGNVPSKCYTYYKANPYSSALSFSNIRNLNVLGVVIRNSTGNGFCGSQVLGNLTITRSAFAFSTNGSNMRLKYKECPITEGTHVRIRHSHFSHGYNVQHSAPASGLTVKIECSSVSVTIEGSSFVRNQAYKGGNLALLIHSNTESYIGTIVMTNCHIEQGNATEGGGVLVTLVENPSPNGTHSGNVSFLYLLHTQFISNYASVLGGGIYFSHLENPGPSSLARKLVIDSCTFWHNRKGPFTSTPGGVAIHIEQFHIPGYVSREVPQILVEVKNSNLSKNIDEQQCGRSAAMYAIKEPRISITDSTLSNNSCTGITAINTNVIFEGNVTISGNHGNIGGAISLYESLVYFQLNTSLLLSDNSAGETGGAIHAEETTLQSRPPCFFQLVTNKTLSKKLSRTVNVILQNNIAAVAGSAVYGGSIDNCYFLSTQRIVNTIPPEYVFNTIFHPTTSPGPKDTSFISSDPIGVCFCNNGTPACDMKSRNVSVYPGQTLKLSAVAVGQRNGIVPGSVVATAIGCNITNTQQIQHTPHSTCFTLLYTVRTENRSARITLGVQMTRNNLFDLPVINLTIIDCPIGFTYTQQQCKCNSHLVDNNMSCDIDSGVVHRVSPWWVGACPHNTSKETHVAIVYCVAAMGHCSSGAVNITTTNSSIESDIQCAPHRTGIVCGACKPGYSLTLGGNQCRKCSNKYIPVVLSFAVGGLVLVVILTALNLTVTEGAINGLIFYANIVQANAHVFFPSLPNNPVLKVLVSIPQVFIAWLNLDVGIEMCFYNGLDAYTKTWLQFAFSIYIWVLAGVIVFLSRRYTIVARTTGRHAVQVLATLFLLSFAKLLSTIISSVSFFALECGTKVTVWLPDGNIEYLRGKHIPLFGAALVAAICIVAPYTVILVFIQCLQRVHLGLISRIKPIIDAYTGPYKDRCRFLTGHLLLIRIILFVYGAEIFNPSLRAVEYTLVACVHLLMLNVWVFRGVYKKYTLDILESSYILNLTVLSASVLYYKYSLKADEKVKYNIIAPILLTTALLTFVGLVFIQAYRQLSTLNIYHALKTKVLRRRQLHGAADTEREPLIASESNSSATASSNNKESTSVHRPAQQPVLAHMRRFDQYREPVLGFEDSN